MKQLNFLLMVMFLTGISCSKTESEDNLLIESLNKKSKIVFFTNAQAILNCGPFDVNVYLDSTLVGSISEPYMVDSFPDCSQKSNTLIIEKESGTYHYSATANCNNYADWSGTISIKPDTCYKIFLDIEKTTNLDNVGNVLFYTNAQMVLNCGEFDVDIYIDSVLVGTLTRASLPVDSIPSCNEVSNEEILKVQKEEGSYSYYALLNCSEYGKCKGEFIVSKDSCTKVFLDINKCQTLK